jgi:CubicO group peptidase (beta-lactamase class C family)
MAQNEKLKTFIDTKIVEKKAPGFQYVVMNAQGVLFEYNRGCSNVETEAKVDQYDVFKAFSATKIFTATAVLQLHDQGLIDLNSPISKYLPQFKFSKEITIVQLLTHSAGVTTTPMIKEIHLEKEHRDFNYDKWVEEFIKANTKIKGTPGNKKKYSNCGYLILGELIKTVSGQDYTSYVQENIINKIDLKQNYLGFEIPEKAVTGYQKRRTLYALIYKLMVDKKYYGQQYKKWQEFNPLYLNGPSYGGMLANARGLALFGLALLDNSNPILAPETHQKLFSPQFNNNEKPLGHSLALWEKTENNEPYYFHPGGGGGSSCELRIYPKKGIVTVYMMNQSQTLNDLKLLSKLDELYFSGE